MTEILSKRTALFSVMFYQEARRAAKELGQKESGQAKIKIVNTKITKTKTKTTRCKTALKYFVES